jgi:diguanylate cyclase (GGDEF)-like protein
MPVLSRLRGLIEPEPAALTTRTENVTREMSATWSAIRSEIQQDSADLHREVLLWQRWVRYAVAALMTFGAIAMLRARGVERDGWIPVGVATGVYLVVVILSSWYLKRSAGQRIVPWLTAVIVVGDVGMMTGLIMLSSPPSQFHRVLLLGLLVIQLTVFYFGLRLGLWATILVAIGYVGSSLTPSAWLPVPGPQPTPMVMAFNGAIFLFVASVLTITFGGFRQRMNALRVFCKRVEIGDLGGAYDLEDDSRPDELTLLARSLDTMRSRLIELIGTDPLTGCLNRRALETRLRREWRQAKRRGSVLAILVVDLDHFKTINDTHGHPVGDMVLQELAEIMKTTARETDAVSRVGGDEFVIVLPDTAWQGAMAFAERLRRNVDEHTFGGDEMLEITISVGVAHARGTDSLSAEELLEQADRNLYKAKDGGRNRISA